MLDVDTDQKIARELDKEYRVFKMRFGSIILFSTSLGMVFSLLIRYLMGELEYDTWLANIVSVIWGMIFATTLTIILMDIMKVWG